MKAFADNADTGGGWGVQNLGKLADVILEHFVTIQNLVLFGSFLPQSCIVC